LAHPLGVVYDAVTRAVVTRREGTQQLHDRKGEDARINAGLVP